MMNNELNIIRYDLAKKITDMQWRGFVIGTAYGDLEISAEEGAAITREVQHVLECRRAALSGLKSKRGQ